MKNINSKNQAATNSEDIQTILTPEIFQAIAKKFDIQTLLQSRLVCKYFNEMFQSHGINELALQSEEYIRNACTSGKYRKYISYWQKAYDNKKISEVLFKKLTITTNIAKYDLEEQLSEDRIIGTKSLVNFGLVIISLILASVGYLNLYHDFDYETWRKCWKDDLKFINGQWGVIDEYGCQEKMDSILFWYFISKTLLAAGLGFIIKTVDHGIAWFVQKDFLLNNDSYILPLLPLKKPLTIINKLGYLLWRVLEYRDIPVFMTGVALSAYVKLTESLHMDIKVCMGVNSYQQTIINESCLTAKSDNILANLNDITVSQGFMYGFSMLGILYLFYKMLEKMCHNAKNNYQTSNYHRFFTSSNSYHRIPKPKDDIEKSLSPSLSL